MHEAADAFSEIARKNPDIPSAMFAIDAASAILNAAREKFSHKNYKEAFQESKDAIRMASSALLIRDGYVASTFEATIMYIADRYQDRLPVDEWQHLESVLTGDGPGLLNLILRLTGKNKKTGEEEASQALTIAERFLVSVKAMVVLG